MESYFKPNYSDFINTFDDIYGYDIATLYVDDVKLFGYLNISPIQERIISKFNYKPADAEIKKPFKAHWMIYESELLLGFVNGVLNGKRLFTSDIVPEFPDTEILFHYIEFSGVIDFVIKEIETSSITDFENYNCDVLRLTFSKGILLSAEKIIIIE